MSKNTDLLKALALVQKSAPSIDKSTKNPFFKSKYADLPTIWNAIKESIAANGLFVSHTMSSTSEGDYISTKIYHVDSGEFMESVSKITLTKVTAQEYGSYITYIRRYALSAMLGLVTDEDDDGNKASQASQPAKNVAQQKPSPAPKPFSGEEFLTMQSSIKSAKSADELKSEWLKFNYAKPRMTLQQVAVLTKAKNDRKIELENNEMDGSNE